MALVVLLLLWVGLELSGVHRRQQVPVATRRAPWGSAAFRQQVVDYLLEVALGSEYGGHAPVVRKWRRDLVLEVRGAPSNADRQGIRQAIAEINPLLGDLEIRLAGDDRGNVEVYFGPSAAFSDYDPNYVPGNRSFFWCWWSPSSELVQARILIPTDADIHQEERDHLILSSLARSLGLMNESSRYRDSVFYDGDNREVQRLAEIDRELIRALYRPEVLPGMTAKRVEEVLTAEKGPATKGTG